MFTLTRSQTTALALAAAGLFLAVPRPVASARAAQDPAAVQAARDAVLAYHIKDEKGGSAEAGRPLFEQRCAVCHSFGGIGKDVGPDLTTVTSRFKKRDVLESILWPSREISDQYQSEMFELSDGSLVSGVLVRETAAAVLVRSPATPDKPVVISKAQITTRTPSTVSLMPEGLLEDLSATQVADLLAFVMAPPPEK